MKTIDITGEKYGMLTVVRRAEATGKLTSWHCLCDCGKSAIVSTKSIRNGGTRSCGCLHIKHAMEHVKRNTRLVGFKRVKKGNGHILVKTENGFVFEHVDIMEKMLGRKLAEGEVVHHKDHDKLNNDPSNLVLMTNGEHTAMHSTGRVVSEKTRKAMSKSSSRLTNDQAEELRSLLSSGCTQKESAKKFGVSQMTASRISRNLTYKDRNHGVS